MKKILALLACLVLLLAPVAVAQEENPEGIVITAPSAGATPEVGPITVSGTVHRAPEPEPDDNCINDPEGDALVPEDPAAADPWDILELCGEVGASEVVITIRTAGMFVDQAAGEALGPVAYAVQVDDRRWVVFAELGEYLVLEGEDPADAVTATSEEDTLTVRIPLDLLGGAPIAVHVETHIIADGEELTILDRAPDEGALLFAGPNDSPEPGPSFLDGILDELPDPEVPASSTASAQTASDDPPAQPMTGVERVEVYLNNVFRVQADVQTSETSPTGAWSVTLGLKEVGPATVRVDWLDGDDQLLGTTQVAIEVKPIALPTFTGAPPKTTAEGTGFGETVAVAPATSDPCPFGFGEGCVPAWARALDEEPEIVLPLPPGREVPAVLQYQDMLAAPVLFGLDQAAADEAKTTPGAGILPMLGVLLLLGAVLRQRRR